MGLLEGKVCLITGAGRGIGRAIAELFAAEGALVYANDFRPGSVDDWCAGKEGVRSLYFDITSPAEVRDAMGVIKREQGKLSVLVNNAGVEYNELIGMISRTHMEQMFAVNVFGAIEVLQAASRLMERGGGGSILNIASMVALRGNRGQLVYSATKGAVVSLTMSAAKELAEKNIRVNAIAPGLTKTEMMDAAAQEKLQSRIDNICMGRLAVPEDIARAALFFASELSTYVSGQVLAVDGCTIM